MAAQTLRGERVAPCHATDTFAVMDVPSYAAAFEDWLRSDPKAVAEAASPRPRFADRVETMSALLESLYDAGWSRYGWPEAVSGFGGTIVHRAAMWEALARHGVQSMAIYEHLEVLAPVLVARDHRPSWQRPSRSTCEDTNPGPRDSRSRAPGQTSRRSGTRAVETDDGYLIKGRKIWTSWARYATLGLVLARTGTPESRHRGLTAFIVDLRSSGVEVNAIEQANGTDELAEVAFDDVHVPGDRIVGEVGGGWQVAMHILSHERGTYPWFRHGFLDRQLRAGLDHDATRTDRALGEAMLDLTPCGAQAGSPCRPTLGQRPSDPVPLSPSSFCAPPRRRFRTGCSPTTPTSRSAPSRTR